MRYFLCVLLLVLYVACGKSGGSSHHPETAQNLSFFSAPAHTQSYRSDSAYAETVQRCIYGITAANSCSPAQLPLLGQTGRPIRVQDILDRTAVSHAFLGDSFRDVLTALDPSALALFSAVSAVVISDRINPSFYNADTTTIYLAARYFWRTAEENAKLSHPRDQRDEYAESFRFSLEYDYRFGDHTFLSRTSGTRSPTTILRSVARLLFHELTHANDAYPPAAIAAGLPSDTSYYQQTDDHLRGKTLLSEHLPSYPSSQLLKRVERVLQTGKDPNDLRAQVTAETFVDEFRRDVVNDDYGYFNPREDAAMLVEEALMAHFFGATRVFAVRKLKADGTTDNADPQALFWAQTGVIFSPAIGRRALYVVENILGGELKDQVATSLQDRTTKTFTEGVTWSEIKNAQL